jgi:GT2 family glycosyltransferase
MEPIIIIPYINHAEIQQLKHSLGHKLPVFFWEDTGRIGSDLAYQTMWNMFPNKDVIILHADMLPMPEDTENRWYKDLLNYVQKHPEAGIFGTTLLYPAKSDNSKYYIQHAGGRFVNGEAIHFGGGLELFSSSANRQLEEDEGQYDTLREVSWVTFGGIYLRRSVINDCGSFDPAYYWTYYRDVDYCLTARSRGWKIYQTPVKLLHFEGKDNKRIQRQDPRRAEQSFINHKIFADKWQGSKLLNTIDIQVVDEKEQ